MKTEIQTPQDDVFINKLTQIVLNNHRHFTYLIQSSLDTILIQQTYSTE